MFQLSGVHCKPKPYTWVVVKIMVPFWAPNIVRHLIFRVPQKGTLILTPTHMQVPIL